MISNTILQLMELGLLRETLGQRICKMSWEPLIAPESKEVFKKQQQKKKRAYKRDLRANLKDLPLAKDVTI